MQSVPGGFWQWLSTRGGDDLAGFILAVSTVIVLVIAIVCTTIYKVHKTRADDALKRELLDRGLGADEIATIINAKSTGKDWWRRHSSS